jgi:hypothetical protein
VEHDGPGAGRPRSRAGLEAGSCGYCVPEGAGPVLPRGVRMAA